MPQHAAEHARITWPQDLRAEPELLARLGGKAGALARLELGESGGELPIPPWFAVLPGVVDARELEAALERLAGGAEVAFAVRSSALREDSAQASFAGLYESFLDVPHAKVAEKIEAVFASADSDRVATYWREQGLSGTPNPPTVLVQLMLRPDWAGVAFSADPVSGRRAVAVVSSVQGLGERLVSGEANAHTCRVNSIGIVLEETPGDDAPLPTPSIAAVAQLARDCERRFGQPQDIEWAIAGERLWLLQSRPITSLRGLPDPDGEFQIWDNSNIAESYPGAISALTFSFASGVYEAVYREFCRILSVPPERIAASSRVFANMLGWHRGRIYYNLLNWYRVLALLPGFQLNRGLMEKMMGVGQELPRERIQAVLPPPEPGLGAKLRAAAALGAGVLALGWQLLRLSHTVRRFHARLEGALASITEPEHQRLEELAASYRHFEDCLLLRWDAPLINDFFAMIFHGLLRQACIRWLGDEAHANSLLLDTGKIISAEPAKRIRQLAEQAAPHPELLAALEAGRLRAVLQSAPTPWRMDLEDYLQKFGDRCAEELKLESPTLRDDPAPLLRSISALAGRTQAAKKQETAPEDALEAASIIACGPSSPEMEMGPPPVPGLLKPLVYDLLWRLARRTVIQRENLRFERTRVFGAVRRIFVEIGKRLWAEGKLAAPDDVFHLTVPEVLGYIEGNGATTDLAATAALRRAEHTRWLAQAPPPNRFATYGAPGLTEVFQPMARRAAPVAEGAPAYANQRRGLGACPGVVRARAVVVRDPRRDAFPQGAILVAERTDPGWVVLFPLAAGIIVEHGSLLSHTAIVARELRIPTVLGVQDATAWLEGGGEVEIDGALGSVKKLSHSNAGQNPAHG